MHAHWIEILDGADNHDVVSVIAHHLEFELLPTKQRALDQHGVHGREIETAHHHALELLAVIGDAAASSAERERRTDDRREAGLLDAGDRFVKRRHGAARGAGQANALHRLGEQLAIFGDANRARVCADQLTAVLLEHAVVIQCQRDIQCGLSTHRRQDRIGTLARNDLLDELRGDRFDVCPVRELRIRHDRRRIGVHQHDFVPFFTQRLRGLRSGVVELGGLADHDWPRANDEDSVQVSALRHA